MKRIITIFLAFVCLQACTKDNSHKEGLLSFGIAGSDDIMVQTKAGSATLDECDYSNFIVNAGSVTDGTKFITDAAFSSIKDQKYIVEEGRYEASAYNVTESDAHPAGGFGSVRYYGITYFDVKAGELTTASIPCSVVNSMVSVILDDTFLQAFDYNHTTITITTNAARSERALSFTSENYSAGVGNGYLLTSSDAAATTPDIGKSAFYPAGTRLYISISAKLNSLSGNGAVKTYTYNGTSSADGAILSTAEATWHKIIISADLSSAPQGITIKVGEKQETIHNGISINGYQNGSLTEDE